uniref:UMOD/GP2/OIT3-like D8C domain-containing protein n=1 Tax=Nothobranchius furzeri TaxID=105023 RepID=A0A8C6PEE5_NOTFU
CHICLCVYVMTIFINGVLQCADPCDHYSVLNDSWRSVDNANNPLHCDRNINWAGWYRFFLGQADARIPEKCVAELRCGTYAPLWITAPHPTQMNQTVTRSVCGAWSGSCCYLSSNPIQIKLCNGFYVYKPVYPTWCDYAYCAGAWPSLVKENG